MNNKLNLKTLIKIAFALSCSFLEQDILRAQVSPPAATQAEVDAGLIRNKYVSPLTLANSAGGGGGITAAVATNVANFVVGQGQVELIHSGVVSNYGTRIEQAVSNAVAGDSVLIKGGSYNITNGLWVKRGVNLDGVDNPVIYNWGSNDLSALSYGIVMAANVAVKNIVISNVYHPKGFQVALGFNHAHNWEIAPTNWLVDGVTTYGDSDGFLLRHTNTTSGVLRYSTFHHRFDGIVFICQAGFTPSLNVDVNNCTVISPGHSVFSPGGNSEHGIGLDGYWRGGSLNIRNCYVVATNNATGGRALAWSNNGADASTRVDWNVSDSTIIGTNYFVGEDDIGASIIRFSNNRLMGDASVLDSSFVYILNSIVNDVYTGNGAGLTNLNYSSINGNLWGTNAATGEITNKNSSLGVNISAFLHVTNTSGANNQYVTLGGDGASVGILTKENTTGAYTAVGGALGPGSLDVFNTASERLIIARGIIQSMGLTNHGTFTNFGPADFGKLNSTNITVTNAASYTTIGTGAGGLTNSVYIASPIISAVTPGSSTDASLSAGGNATLNLKRNGGGDLAQISFRSGATFVGQIGILENNNAFISNLQSNRFYGSIHAPLIVGTNGLISYATNYSPNVNTAGFTNSGTAPGFGGTNTMMARITATSGTLEFYTRSGLNGQTICGVGVWTNALSAFAYPPFQVGVNQGFIIRSPVGVDIQVYAQ